MNAETPFALLSAYNPDWALPSTNDGREAFLARQLEMRGIAHGPVELFDPRLRGIAHANSKRPGFIVRLPADAGNFQYVIQLARRYGQSWIVYVDANRYASLLMLYSGSGGLGVAETIHLGGWGEVDPSRAIASTSDRSYGIREIATRDAA